MQQEKELRIGNLIKNELNEVIIVTQLGINDIGYNITYSSSPTDKKSRVHSDKCFPIDLTKEILELLGFEKNTSSEFSNRTVYTKDNCSLNEKFQLCTYDGAIAITGKRIEFIHQIQNLYLLIVGNELNIDNDKLYDLINNSSK